MAETPCQKCKRERDELAALLDKAKRFVSDRTLFSDPTLRYELARLLGVQVGPRPPRPCTHPDIFVGPDGVCKACGAKPCDTG